jgi:hypothetical protein
LFGTDGAPSRRQESELLTQLDRTAQFTHRLLALA